MGLDWTFFIQPFATIGAICIAIVSLLKLRAEKDNTQVKMMAAMQTANIKMMSELKAESIAGYDRFRELLERHHKLEKDYIRLQLEYTDVREICDRLVLDNDEKTKQLKALNEELHALYDQIKTGRAVTHIRRSP